MAELLFLCHRMPYPPNKGDKIRAHAILAHLAKRYRIHLACPVDDPADMAHAPYLRDLLGGDCLFVPLQKKKALMRAAASALRGRSLSDGYFSSRAIRQWIGALLRRRPVNRGIAFGSAMAPYLLNQPGLAPERCILDMVDVDSDKWAQYARKRLPPTRWIYGLEAHRLARLERRAALSFAATTLVSPHEAGTLREMEPAAAAKIHSVPNGVDFHYFDPSRGFENPYPADCQAIVMTGQMDYWPNIQAAEWFAAQVMPLLAVTLPKARFFVAGANPPAGFLAKNPRVTVTGRVADVRPYLAHAAVAVAPLQVARGVQNKVLEAMAMARAVVASSAAVRALTIVPGQDLLVADRPAEFAEAVFQAMQSPLAQTLGAHGRSYVERHHDWSRSLLAFDHMLDAIGEEPAPVSPFPSRLLMPAPVPEVR